MRRFAPALAVLMLAPACAKPAPAQVQVTGAWVRLPAVSGRPGAAYFTVHGGEKPERLIAISSPQAGRVELHEGGMHDGMMTMRPLNGINVAAGAAVQFAPGGNHAMVFDIRPSVGAGGTVPMTFYFQSGKTVATEAKAVAAGGPAPAQ